MGKKTYTFGVMSLAVTGRHSKVNLKQAPLRAHHQRCVVRGPHPSHSKVNLKQAPLRAHHQRCVVRGPHPRTQL